jgi:hypothetical protein
MGSKSSKNGWKAHVYLEEGEGFVPTVSYQTSKKGPLSYSFDRQSVCDTLRLATKAAEDYARLLNEIEHVPERADNMMRPADLPKGRFATAFECKAGKVKNPGPVKFAPKIRAAGRKKTP